MKLIDRAQLTDLWSRFRQTLADPQRLRAAAAHNLPLKFVSLVIACGIWAFVNLGERDTEETLKVPLELRNIPAQLMITSPRVDFVDVRVSGPRNLLGRIDRSRLSVPLELGGVKVGPSVFRVAGESLNLPRGVRVVRLNPAQVTMELERISHKTVPVRLRLVGKLSPDLQVVDTKVSPETVQISGPTSDIENVHAASTEAVDLSKMQAGTIERELPLEPAGDYIAFSASRVATQIRIDELPATREFKAQPIRIRNAAQTVSVIPSTVRLTVRGPKRAVGSFELGENAVSIDASQLSAGETAIKPVVELPEGIEAVSMEPAQVRVIVGPPRPKRR